jgi:hypothetical protein
MVWVTMPGDAAVHGELPTAKVGTITALSEEDEP